MRGDGATENNENIYFSKSAEIYKFSSLLELRYSTLLIDTDMNGFFDSKLCKFGLKCMMGENFS